MTPVEAPESITLSDSISSKTYELQSLVVHAGQSADYGHYYSLGRQNSTWHLLNDSSVTQLTGPLPDFI